MSLRSEFLTKAMEAQALRRFSMEKAAQVLHHSSKDWAARVLHHSSMATAAQVPRHSSPRLFRCRYRQQRSSGPSRRRELPSPRGT